MRWQIGVFMVNQVTLIGRLGKDPEIRNTPNGNTVGNFSLATTEFRNGEKSTSWHNIVVVGKNAENCGKYCRKGMLVYIDGKIQYSSWDDRDGNKRSKTEIFAMRVQFLEQKRDENQQSAPARQPAPPQYDEYNQSYGY